MNILFLRRLALAFVVLTLTVLLSGCLLPGGGGYYDGGGIGAAYYEPSGVEYGGWGHGYHVAPFRGGDHRQTSGGGHAYRSAPASHATPSLPSHGGGGRGGSGGKRR
jgi:hypothetical protein